MVHNQLSTAPLPSDPRFRNLDRLILQLEAHPRQPRKAVLKLRRRWIERAVPAFVPQQESGVQR